MIHLLHFVLISKKAELPGDAEQKPQQEDFPVAFGFSVLKPILCEGALRHRNTREQYSNNLRAVGPNHAQLKTKQNRKQDNKQGTGVKTG